jgi:hypothetical protein
MSDINNMDKYMKMIVKSLECAKEHHKVKFYTDKETLPHLTDIDIDKTIIDTEGFYFVDDFKVHLLSVIEDDEVLIDTDLFLFSPIKLEKGYDIYLDFKDESTKSWYKGYIDYFINRGVTDIVPNFIQPHVFVPNIGILKINNEDLKKEYIDIYKKVREWLLLTDDNINKGTSIILGQYLLGLTLQNNKYSSYYCYNGKNHYLHFSGPKKFREGILDYINPIKIKRLI